jgi:orotate phosphoribosyltransferase
MRYRSVADLDDDIVEWLPRLPRDLELIVGIPRSGLLAANLLALHLNLPMTDVEGLIAGRVLQPGPRYAAGVAGLLDKPANILVVDDSVLFGSQLETVKKRITAAHLSHAVRYAALYPAPGSQRHVDFFFEIVKTPRCFEWNLMHHPWILSKTCMDIDGVLCRDPTPAENDDGPEYQRFLQSADRRYLPSAPVRWLVTSRLEKYRTATEGWLAANGVEYGELMMMEYPDMDARRAANAYSSFKASIYNRTGAILFVESSALLAAEIARLSGKSVFCVETKRMIDPALLPRVRHKTGELRHRALGRMGRVVHTLMARLRG